MSVCNWPYQVSGKCAQSIEEFHKSQGSRTKNQDEWDYNGDQWFNEEEKGEMRRYKIEKMPRSDKSVCQKEGFKRDEKDCHIFYQCVPDDYGNFEEYRFFCPSGLVFDEEKEVCNWPYEVLDCGKG